MDIQQRLVELLPVDVQEPTRAWLSRMRENTATVYARDLIHWIKHCTANKIDLLTPGLPKVDLYCAALNEQLAPATVNRRMSAISSWYDYLVQCHETDNNLFRGARRPRVPKGKANETWLDLVECDRLLEAAEEANGAQGKRDAAMMRLMITLGIRVAEVSALKISSMRVVGGQRVLHVRGKGGEMVDRPLPEKLARSLDTYLGALPHTGFLFITGTGKQVSPGYISKLVIRFATAAGLPDPHRFTAHALRHTFATDADELGADIKDIQTAMGHADERTTRGYIDARRDLANDPAHRMDAALR